jgi:nucleoid DNA-binding protein
MSESTTDLIDLVATRMEVPNTQAKKFLQSLSAIIIEEVVKGNEVKLI